MNISSRCEYGCRALIELARNERSDRPITAETIAERWHIPEQFLIHVMLQLKHAGLVRSVRGAQGGYLLARPAHAITLLDAVSAIDGPIMAALPVQDDVAETLAPFWAEVGGRIESALRATTIRAVCDSLSTGPMFYI